MTNTQKVEGMRMEKYHISYGPEHITAGTLKKAREEAKRISRRVIYEIKIVANGDVLETWTPRVTAKGTIAFRVSQSKA